MGERVISFLFGGSKPQAPPPPPSPASLSSTSIMQQAAAERETLASASGAGFGGTDVTGGKGVTNEKTTKSLLGG